ncbi:hypothetical protein GCM10010435_16240 [Winogradskya consettensis]|uniref:Uncharacterized protein n=1 Tax=Winogradskya consettensis TaxID=113560 RepID=A0A919VU15_9ACTN|nr:hypothetical protein [Actinoplanes consettensis]GIM78894.1 hypothetical protein Aco04nite_62810 [Actinoplanes consettensis]
MSTQIKIGLHEVSRVRWPRQTLVGDGKQVKVAVPLPRLPWSSASVEVPMGESAARGIERVTRLRKIFGYGVAPAIILLFVVADALLLWGRFGDLKPPGALFAIFGVVGVVLILTGLVPDVVARATGTPYVTRGTLRFSKARTEAVEQLAKLNPQLQLDSVTKG